MGKIKKKEHYAATKTNVLQKNYVGFFTNYIFYFKTDIHVTKCMRDKLHEIQSRDGYLNISKIFKYH